MATQPTISLTDGRLWRNVTLAFTLEAGKQYYFEAKGFALEILDVLTADGTPDGTVTSTTEGQDLYPEDRARLYTQRADETCWARAIQHDRIARLLMTEK